MKKFLIELLYLDKKYKYLLTIIFTILYCSSSIDIIPECLIHNSFAYIDDVIIVILAIVSIILRMKGWLVNEANTKEIYSTIIDASNMGNDISNISSGDNSNKSMDIKCNSDVSDIDFIDYNSDKNIEQEDKNGYESDFGNNDSLSIIDDDKLKCFKTITEQLKKSE